MLVPNTNTKARCTGDDETPPRPGTRPVDAAQFAVEDTSIGGPEFAATPGVAARGPKTGAAVCVYVHVGVLTTYLLTRVLVVSTYLLTYLLTESKR